jgi:hypothetical protein
MQKPAVCQSRRPLFVVCHFAHWQLTQESGFLAMFLLLHLVAVAVRERLVFAYLGRSRYYFSMKRFRENDVRNRKNAVAAPFLQIYQNLPRGSSNELEGSNS